MNKFLKAYKLKKEKLTKKEDKCLLKLKKKKNKISGMILKKK
jgi:hypothetical protein